MQRSTQYVVNEKTHRILCYSETILFRFNKCNGKGIHCMPRTVSRANITFIRSNWRKIKPRKRKTRLKFIKLWNLSFETKLTFYSHIYKGEKWICYWFGFLSIIKCIHEYSSTSLFIREKWAFVENRTMFHIMISTRYTKPVMAQ